MDEPVINLESLDEKNMSNGKSNKNIILVVLIVAAVALGAFTGYYFSGKKLTIGTSKAGTTGVIPSEKITKGVEFGAKDTGKADSATGVIEKGGIDGEGTHKLLREGGPSQNVYLTSSVLDLDQFSGMKIQVWGETMKAQKAGWLMDVIKVKILE